MQNNRATEKEAKTVRIDDLDVEAKVTLFNCNCHSIEEVIEQVQKATACGYQSALQLTNIAHHSGSVVVYRGGRKKCNEVAEVLGRTGLQVAVS